MVDLGWTSTFEDSTGTNGKSYFPTTAGSYTCQFEMDDVSCATNDGSDGIDNYSPWLDPLIVKEGNKYLHTL